MQTSTMALWAARYPTLLTAPALAATIQPASGGVARLKLHLPAGTQQLLPDAMGR
jgi:hypothetical protein